MRQVQGTLEYPDGTPSHGTLVITALSSSDSVVRGSVSRIDIGDDGGYDFGLNNGTYRVAFDTGDDTRVLGIAVVSDGTAIDIASLIEESRMCCGDESGPASFEDAPDNGIQYARQNREWVSNYLSIKGAKSVAADYQLAIADAWMLVLPAGDLTLPASQYLQAGWSAYIANRSERPINLGVAGDDDTILGESNVSIRPQTTWAVTYIGGGEFLYLGENLNIADPVVIGAHSTASTFEGVTQKGSVAIGFRAEVRSPTAVGIGSTYVREGKSGVAIGNQAIALGDSSVAIGGESSPFGGRGNAGALADGATAVGNDAFAINEDCLALGTNASANDPRTTAIGLQANANAELALAMCYRANANRPESVAIGNRANTNGENSVALGPDVQANGNYSYAAGSGARATGDGSVGIGRNSRSFGFQSAGIAIGDAAISSDSTSLGSGARSAVRGIAVGRDAGAEAPDVIAIGNDSQSLAPSALALGDGASGEFPDAVVLGHGAKNSSVTGGMQVNALPYLPMSYNHPDGASAADSTRQSASQVVIGTSAIDLTDSEAVQSLSIPGGTFFMIDSVDVVITSADGAGGSPAINVGTSESGSDIVSNGEITKTEAGGRNVLPPETDDGVSALHVSLSSPGTGDEYAAKMIVRGYVVDAQ